jgi:hypothetical protein
MKWLIVFAAIVATTSAFAESSHHIGSWIISETPDPMTDEPRIVATLPGVDLSLNIRCTRGKPQMTVVTNHQYQAGEQVAVAMRIDGLPARIAEWHAEPGTGRAWATISRVSYAAILKLKKIAIEVFQKDNISATYQFSADKTEIALSALAKACPIESAADVVPQLFDPKDVPVFSDNKLIMPDKKDEPKGGEGK